MSAGIIPILLTKKIIHSRCYQINPSKVKCYGKSTANALTIITVTLCQALDKKGACRFVDLDISKMCDILDAAFLPKQLDF